MAWKVAVILDTETHPGCYLGMMPTWALSTPDRESITTELRTQWNSCWAPEPALTLFAASHPPDSVAALVDQMSTIKEHHPNLSCFRLFGLPESEYLTRTMAELGYHPVFDTSYEGLAFAQQLDKLPNLPNVIVDFRELKNGASEWQIMNYFYDEFFRAVGAPTWHGRNYDALIDSIEGGAINQIEVPYQVVIRNVPSGNNAVEHLLNDFTDLVRGMQSNGCPIAILIEN